MANLKSGNVIVRILLVHGEKIGMLAIVVCAAMLFWSALNSEQLGEDNQPEKLVQLANRANQHVLGFKWDELDAENQLHAEPISGEAMAPVVRNHFPPLRDPMTRPVLDPVSLRTDPGLLAVEDLEVHGDSGLWASANPETIKKEMLEAFKKRQKEKQEEDKKLAKNRDEREGGRGGRGEPGGRGGGEIFGRGRGEDQRDTPGARRDGPIIVSGNSRSKLQGFEQISANSWVTVVAKVPIEKQSELFEDALLNTSGYDDGRDAPIYVGYFVERAEVTDEGDGPWKKLPSVNTKSLKKTVETYPLAPMDLVSSRYKHPLLTHPLPPLVLRDWDQRVTHSSIPLISEEVPEDELDQEDSEDSDASADEGDEFDMGAEDSQDGRQFGGPGGRRGMAGGYGEGMYGGRGGRGGEGEGMYGGPGGMGEGMYGGRGGQGEEMYGGRGGQGEEMYGGRGGMGGRRGGISTMYTWDRETSHLLFRYFDNTVKPGHQYRYRVRLALADVNHNIPEQYLDKTVTERRSKIKSKVLKKYTFTDWSEPSPVASVPLPARVYLVDSVPANEATFDDEPEANMLVKVFNSELPAELAKNEEFLRGSVLNFAAKASVIWADRADRDEEDKWNEEFEFRTGITVLDFRGGEKLSSKNRDLTAPARAVLMDLAGRMFLQNEMDDSESVAEYEDVIEGGQDSRNRRGGRGGGFEGGEGMFGGEGMYGGER